MIDKSVPYFEMAMCRPGNLPLPKAPALPEGYAYHLYAPGDIAAWSRIETAVDEFDAEEKARAYFEKTFLPFEEELRRRGVFILDADGQAVADATAWWQEDPGLGRVAQLHWVATLPEVQGKGLGRAVVCKALSLYETEGPRGDIWLTTQTWSHVAIALYLSLGFRAHKHYRLGGRKNGYEQALPILERVMRPEMFAQLVDTALE